MLSLAVPAFAAAPPAAPAKAATSAVASTTVKGEDGGKPAKAAYAPKAAMPKDDAPRAAANKIPQKSAAAPKAADKDKQ